MKSFNGHNKAIGKIGEDTACVFLVKHGFEVIERNHLRKWGEIDIVAKRAKKLYFIEVKSVSCENLDNVTHVTETHRPEDNVHFQKRLRLSRVFQTYLSERNYPDSALWQFDVVTVYVCLKERRSLVGVLEDVII